MQVMDRVAKSAQQQTVGGGIDTQAWVLHDLSRGEAPRDLQLEPFRIGPVQSDEVLVEPLYGSWEGNMGHAVARKPIDIARQRGEERVVVGNSGVVRVLQPGSPDSGLVEGDICLYLGGVWDEHRYMKYAAGYDAPGTVGLLARRTKAYRSQLVKLPRNSRFHLAQWAVFSLRYVTAWGNWTVASQCYNATRPRSPSYEPWVWGWGGGTAFAEIALAHLHGYKTAFISSNPVRLRQIEAAGVLPIDRREFAGLVHDEKKIAADAAYAEAYQQAEKSFLRRTRQVTGGQGVSIFLDQIGSAVTPATLKALARPAVIASCGWKTGMNVRFNRAVAAMNWHIHVNTHYARYEDCAPAVAFGEERGWMPPLDSRIYEYDEIPQLADDYATGRLDTYFPVYRVNPE